MPTPVVLPFVKHLQKQLKPSAPSLIQVVLGPRQVGKTTGVKQILSKMKEGSYLYVTADGAIAKSSAWVLEQWLMASQSKSTKLLVIDEIQKVEGWAEAIKELWDKKPKFKLVLLGSSSLFLQQGLNESLAGRYFIHRVHHWDHQQSKQGYRLNFEQFLLYGGYPGSYPFTKTPTEWLSYLQHSIVDAVIGKDILTQVRVKSPALFKQCFEIATSYPAQEISYTKLLGQLQSKGNVDLVKSYLRLFEEAYLLKQLYKYSAKKVIQKSSSPKILPLCPALYTLGLDAQLDQEERGRSFELYIGCELLKKPGELFYWRKRNDEVDYVYKFGKKLLAIEVKSGRKKSAKGLAAFAKEHPKAQLLLVTPENFEEVLESI